MAFCSPCPYCVVAQNNLLRARARPPSFLPRKEQISFARISCLTSPSLTCPVKGRKPLATFFLCNARQLVPSSSFSIFSFTRKDPFNFIPPRRASSSYSSQEVHKADDSERSLEPPEAPDQAPIAVHSREQGVGEHLRVIVGVGLFFLLDTSLKAAFVAARVQFPSSLFGMLCIFTALLAADVVRPDIASSVDSFFSPGLTWIGRYMPLFYVPSLIVLPLAVRGIPLAAATKLVVILCLGWVSTLAATGFAANFVRDLVNSRLQAGGPRAAKAAPFSEQEQTLWGLTAGASLIPAVAIPTLLGDATLPGAAIPLFISATAGGYVWGSRMPEEVRQKLHPLILCALVGNAAAFILATLTGRSYFHTLGAYLTSQGQLPGAGNLLLSFLGPVILSFAFNMYRQRKVMRRHAVEIASAVLLSSIFSLFSTALAGRLLGLQGLLTCALVPRCITVALALPIASLLQASNASLTAAAVVLTGLLGANFGQPLMNRLGFKDPLTRGMAIACSAHGLGTAAMAASEPEALPFCAVSFALTGVFSSVLCALPAIQAAIIFAAGGV